MIIAYTVIGLILLAAVLEDAFVYCFTVRRLMESGVWMPTNMRLRARILYPIGALADVLYNQTYGRVWFRQLSSHGWMFSNRVQWNVDNATGARLATAVRWAKLLNAVAPDHIKRVPGEEIEDTPL